MRFAKILIATRVNVVAADDHVDHRWLLDIDGRVLNRNRDQRGARGVELCDASEALRRRWDSDALFMCFQPLWCPPGRITKAAIAGGRIPVKMLWLGVDMDLPGKSWAGIDFMAFCRKHLTGPIASRFIWWQTRGGLRGIAPLSHQFVLNSQESLDEYEARLRSHRLALQSETGLEFDPAACDDATRLQRIAHGVRDNGPQNLRWFKATSRPVDLRRYEPAWKPGESPEERIELQRRRDERIASIRARGGFRAIEDRFDRAMNYMAAIDVAGEGNRHIAARAALWRIVLGFALDEGEAVELAHAFNATKLDPPVADKEIERVARDCHRRARDHANRGDMLADDEWERPKEWWHKYSVEPTEAEAADATLYVEMIVNALQSDEVPPEPPRSGPRPESGTECLPGDMDPGDGGDHDGQQSGDSDAGGGSAVAPADDPEATAQAARHQELEAVCSFDSLLLGTVENPGCTCGDEWDSPAVCTRDVYQLLERTPNISLRGLAADLRSCQAGIDRPEIHHLESVFGTSRWRCRKAKFCPLCAWVQAHNLGDSLLETMDAGEIETAAVWRIEFAGDSLMQARHRAQRWVTAELSSRAVGRESHLLRVFSRRESVPAAMNDGTAVQVLYVFCLNEEYFEEVDAAVRAESAFAHLRFAGGASAGMARRIAINALHIPDWFEEDDAGVAMEEYFHAESGEPAFNKSGGMSAIWVNADPRREEGDPKRGEFKSVVYARELAAHAEHDKRTAVAVVKTKIREYVRYDAGAQPHEPVVRFAWDGRWIDWKNQKTGDAPKAPEELRGWRAWEMLLEMQTLLQGDPTEALMSIRSLFDQIARRDGPTRRGPGEEAESALPREVRVDIRENAALWDQQEALATDAFLEWARAGKYAQRVIEFHEGSAA